MTNVVALLRRRDIRLLQFRPCPGCGIEVSRIDFSGGAVKIERPPQSTSGKGPEFVTADPHTCWWQSPGGKPK